MSSHTGGDVLSTAPTYVGPHASRVAAKPLHTVWLQHDMPAAAPAAPSARGPAPSWPPPPPCEQHPAPCLPPTADLGCVCKGARQARDNSPINELHDDRHLVWGNLANVARSAGCIGEQAAVLRYAPASLAALSACALRSCSRAMRRSSRRGSSVSARAARVSASWNGSRRAHPAAFQ